MDYSTKKCFSSKAKAQCLTKNNEANLAKEGKKLALKKSCEELQPTSFLFNYYFEK